MKILTEKLVRAAEEDAVNSGIFSYVEMMQNAAKQAFLYLKENVVDKGDKICVVCGSGNNGGDGLVLAKLLKNITSDVTLVLPNGMPKSNPANEFSEFVSDIKTADKVPEKCDVLIDALFGIGLNRPLEGEIVKTVNAMNNCLAKKVAVDIPSGVNADGEFAFNAFKADLSLTFIALKPCFVSPFTSDFCGKVEVLDIGVKPKMFYGEISKKPSYIARNKNSHKGTYGTALMLTGSYGMCGASILSAKAALASGVGIVKNFVCDKNYTAFTSSIPEAVTIPCKTCTAGAPFIDDKTLFDGLEGATAFLIGCGLGVSEEARGLVIRALELANIPVVIDADGINILSSDIELLKKLEVPKIITPHPKEMARLCKTTVNEIERNRGETAKRVAKNTGAIVVLKGANTVIAGPGGELFYNPTGNPGLATGGSGDVLAGMITARICLGESPITAAKNAVWLHGFAADRLSERYNLEGITPSDIIEELKTIRF